MCSTAVGTTAVITHIGMPSLLLRLKPQSMEMKESEYLTGESTRSYFASSITPVPVTVSLAIRHRDALCRSRVVMLFGTLIAGEASTSDPLVLVYATALLLSHIFTLCTHNFGARDSRLCQRRGFVLPTSLYRWLEVVVDALEIVMTLIVACSYR